MMFVGNQLEFYKAGGSKAVFARWQKIYGKIFGIYMMRRPALVVTDAEVLKQILVKDFNNFSDRFFFSNGALVNKEAKPGLFFSGGQDWKRIRSIVSPTFSSAKLKTIFHHITICADRLVKNLEELAVRSEAADAGKIFSAFSLEVIASTGFGVQVDSQKNLDDPLVSHGRSLFAFRRSVLAAVVSIGLFPEVCMPLFNALDIRFFKREDMKYFTDVVGQVVEERRRKPDQANVQTDLISLLINAESETDNEGISPDGSNGTSSSTSEKKHLSREEVVGQALIFFFAGFETTSKTLLFSCYEIARNRHVQKRLIDEIDGVFGYVGEDKEHLSYEALQNMPYLEAVIQETLRMYPPLTQISRVALENTTLTKNIRVEAKTGIVIPILHIQRDASNFHNPNKFDPTRFIDPDTGKFRKGGLGSAADYLNILPFGYGPRQCVGERLAMLELKVALIYIFRKLTLDPTTSEEVELSDSTSILLPTKPVMLMPRTRCRVRVSN